MHQTVIRAGFGGELAGRDRRITLADEQALRGVEERLLGVAS
jgi:hypothetical protein